MYFWWYWFRHRHPKLSIKLAKGLEVYNAQGLTNNVCNSFYENLATLYTRHKCIINHIWNHDEIRI